MTPEAELVNLDDIGNLNRAAVERTAAIARLVGAGLLVIGAMAAVGWAWFAFRTQNNAGPFGLNLDGDAVVSGPTLADRIDLLVSSLGLLVTASVACAVGLLCRLAADYTQTRVGGSITGFRVGDSFGADGDELN